MTKTWFTSRASRGFGCAWAKAAREVDARRQGKTNLFGAFSVAQATFPIRRAQGSAHTTHVWSSLSETEVGE